MRKPRYVSWDGSMSQPVMPYLMDQGTDVINIPVHLLYLIGVDNRSSHTNIDNRLMPKETIEVKSKLSTNII